MNLDDALEEMILDYKAAGRSESTIKAYKSMVGAFASQCSKPVREVSRADVRDYFMALRKRNAYEDAPQKPEQKTGLSPHTIASHDRHLRGFFGWCVDVGYIERSPMKGLRQPRPPKLKPKALSARQFVQLLEAAKNYDDPIQGARNVALLATLADTGGRIGEVLSLTDDTIDLDACRGWVLSKGAEREVFFTHFTRGLIRRWLDVREDFSKYVFTSVTTGEPLTPSGVYQMLQRLKKLNHVRGKISAHRFRHGFAVEFVKGGGDVSTLAALLGHQSITTTNDFYSIFSGDELKRLHQQVNPLMQMMRDRI